MAEYYLAVDIGASGGRHILGRLKEGRIQLEEVHRFSNGMVKKDGHLCWDVDKLFREIITGLKKCSEIGKIPVSMGIDTWAVDYVLLDKEDNVLGHTYGYRDGRTNGMDKKVYEKISREDLYAGTGIQKLIFNTIYQLMAVKELEPTMMEEAESLLLLPDYFHFLLTKNKSVEYTNASTTQLVSPVTKNWDWELIKLLGFKESIFAPITMPGTLVGSFTDNIRAEVGFNCKVIQPATHDTASAVMSVPNTGEDVLYISSGTWSLMGTELPKANTSAKSRDANLTNEGGYEYRFRYLKNIMGLWMIQSVKKEFNTDISFAKLCEEASKETITTIVDCNDDCFLAPESMIEAIRMYCIEHSLEVPKTDAAIAAVIYNSLAKCYGDTAGEIEAITGKKYKTINIVGGGSNAAYLNELTAKYTQKSVHAGPTEATAIGNLLAQMIREGIFDNLSQARQCVYDSFDIQVY